MKTGLMQKFRSQSWVRDLQSQMNARWVVCYKGICTPELVKKNDYDKLDTGPSLDSEGADLELPSRTIDGMSPERKEELLQMLVSVVDARAQLKVKVFVVERT